MSVDSLLSQWDEKFTQLEQQKEQALSALTAQESSTRQSTLSRFLSELSHLSTSSASPTSHFSTALDAAATEKSSLAQRKAAAEARLEADRTTLERMEEQQLLKSRGMGHLSQKVLNKADEVDEGRAALQSYVSRCEKFLGLRIEPSTRDTFLFVLKWLDPEDMERTFSVEVETSFEEGTKPYKVLQANPNLGSEMPELEDLLNRSQNLSAFVVALRKKFKAFVVAERK